MSYTLEQAKTIVTKYQYLIGKQLDKTGSINIDFIIITPSENHQHATFMREFNIYHNQDHALYVAGFNKNKVDVEVGTHIKGVYVLDKIDNYLKKAGLPPIEIVEL